MLEYHFPDVPMEPDVRDLEATVDLVIGWLPCAVCPQAGNMKGITGEASGSRR